MSDQRGRGQTEQEFYEEALKTADRGWQATGYGMQINQQMRFDELWKQILSQEEGEYSLLDIGCGTGDLITYLNGKEKVPYRYVGLDPMKEMTERTLETLEAEMSTAARKGLALNAGLDWGVYPGEVDMFLNMGDWRKRGGPFDYAASIAAYALKPPGESMQESMTKVVRLIDDTMEMVNKAAFFTLFSSWKTEIIPEEMVLDPMLVFSWAKAAYERVDLVHSYAPFDFSLVVYKEDSPWRQEWNRMNGRSILRSDD